MKPTIAISRVVLFNDSSKGNNNDRSDEKARVRLKFTINPIGTSDVKKVEIYQIRIIDQNGEVLPVYHSSDEKLDHIGLLIGGEMRESDDFVTHSFEAKADYNNAQIQLILVDTNCNLGHRYQIDLKDGYADAEHYMGDVNPIKLIGLKEGITL